MIDQVGTDDDFFDVGGESLMATELISRVRRLSGIDVELRTLLKAPTVASFAEIINDLTANAHDTHGHPH
jgi:aryl carrier-like protein